MNENKKKTGRSAARYLAGSLLLLAGFMTSVCLAILPTFRDSLAGIRQKASIGSYASAVENMDAETLGKEKENARKYNRMIYERQKKAGWRFRFTGLNGESGSGEVPSGVLPYKELLNYAGDGVMGYVSIPEIGADLPIGHGTASSVLDAGAGHMYGTSLPSGGEGTHCVISAHTGLESARLFTDIARLKEGDIFEIHVLDEVHAYAVDQIKTVLPEEADTFLAISDKEDLVTLYTCTPYGVNSHRLLVRGRRTKDPSAGKRVPESVETVSMNKRAVLKAIFIGALPAAVFAFFLIFIIRNTRKIIRESQSQKDIDSCVGKTEKAKEFRK